MNQTPSKAHEPKEGRCKSLNRVTPNIPYTEARTARMAPAAPMPELQLLSSIGLPFHFVPTLLAPSTPNIINANTIVSPKNSSNHFVLECIFYLFYYFILLFYFIILFY